MATKRTQSRRTPKRDARTEWNKRAASWEKWEPILMNGLAAVNPILFRALELAPGQRVLDIGSGTGDPALAIAQWVGPRGRVVAMDNSDGMLAVAKKRARLLELRNMTFRRADMNRLRHTGKPFDRISARYALMFAADLTRTLEALRQSLAPDGILAAAVWGPIKRNPGAFLREEAALPFFKEPPVDPEQVPGPMRLQRQGLLEGAFVRAGFRDVRCEAVPVATVYESVEDFAQIQLGSALAELYETLGAADRRRLTARLVQRFRRFQDGPLVRVPAHSWVVSGRR